MKHVIIQWVEDPELLEEFGHEISSLEFVKDPNGFPEVFDSKDQAEEFGKDHFSKVYVPYDWNVIPLNHINEDGSHYY